ncbi:MAG: alpha-glucosidase, partial [Gammaproteobacteria bacterium HGW-Gammaproteobacteria-7]
RDGCRTPLPWDDSERADFSTGSPWLPIPCEHRRRAVSRQEADPNSTLHGFRHFMHWRRTEPALRWGDIAFIDSPEPVLAFTRAYQGQRLLAVFNLGEAPVNFALPAELCVARPTNGHGLSEGTMADGHVALPGHGLMFARLG